MRGADGRPSNADGPPVRDEHRSNADGPPSRTARQINRRRPTLPGPRGPSTIGAERLNYSVRNGKRCIPLAMTTERLRDQALLIPELENRKLAASDVQGIKISVKPSKH